MKTGRFVDSRSDDSVNPSAVIWFSRYRRPSSSALHHRTPQWVARKGADRTGGADRGGGPDQRRCHLHGPAASGTRILERSEFLCQGEYFAASGSQRANHHDELSVSASSGPAGRAQQTPAVPGWAGEGRSPELFRHRFGHLPRRSLSPIVRIGMLSFLSRQAGAARLIGHDADCWKAQLEQALGSSDK